MVHMLSRNTISTVKSTVPLLAEHGQAITENFYVRLFDENPELFNLFNRPNQMRGQQQSALAEAVIAYANHIDNLSVLTSAIKRITHKHRSIGISAELYPTVGKHLLDAVADVLELPVEHPALEAWGQAYQFLADAFIAEEKFLDDENQKKLNWTSFQAFEISEMQRETPEVISLWLTPTDNNIVIDYQAGQYVSVMIPNVDNGFDQIRQYSISTWEAEKERIRISIKTESHGRISPFIHMLKVGNEIQVSPPQGVFTLNTAASKHTFISAGIGITPLFSMLKEAIEKHKVSGEKLSFIQCNRSGTYQIYQNELRSFCEEHKISLKQIYELDDHGDHQGIISAKQLQEWIDLDNTDVYYCGPKPFISAVNKELSALGVNESNQHYETFGPTTSLN